MTVFDYISIGFTGSRNEPSDQQRDWLRSELEQFALDYREVDLHHGACVGSDALAHATAVSLGLSVVVHPPLKKSLAMTDFTGKNVLVLPDGEYLERDRAIVDASNVLLALPDGPERKGSGTWYTVNYARKRTGMTIGICYPDGTRDYRWRMND